MLRIDMCSSLRADAWALKQIASFGGGKLLMWSWMSRGYVTTEDMAQWRFNGSQQELLDCMKSCKYSMKHLYELEDITEEDYSDDGKKFEKAKQATLQGETRTVWAILDQDDAEQQAIMLPSWFKSAIDRSIYLWQKESDDWQAKLVKRVQAGKREFAPKAQENYQKWLANNSRRIVLDKDRQSQIVTLKSKNLRELKSSCLVLEVEMNDNPEQLRIRSGNGKFYKLVCLQGVNENEEIPQQLDVLPGESLYKIVT